MIITIWSDFVCPFCFIGEVRLERAVGDLKVENLIRYSYRAFELDPNAPRTPVGDSAERLARKYGMSIEKARAKIDHISDLGRELGLPFRYREAKCTNTFDAHRLMKLVEAEGRPEQAHRLNMALFDAYFCKGLPLADHEVLAQLARDVEMDEKRVREVLKSKEFTAEVRQDELEASRRHIRSVPYMIFGSGPEIPGAVSIEDYKKVIGDNGAFANMNEPGAKCGPDGCRWK